MWDSLESIYLAAKINPDSDVYCVPILYYTLNPDRDFGEMYYEGSEYPRDIEVTDWRECSFEERRPDVVYIHNRYDNWNLVTSGEIALLWCLHPLIESTMKVMWSEVLQKYVMLS